MSDYELHICPVCFAPASADEYADEPACWHEEYGPVEAIVVSAEPDAAQLRARRALALFRLQEERRERDFRVAEERWYENLSVADRFWEDSRRKRIRREELKAAAPMERAMMSMLDGWKDNLEQQLFSERPLLDFFRKGPPPDALDSWLADVDRRMPEVAEALSR